MLFLLFGSPLMIFLAAMSSFSFSGGLFFKAWVLKESALYFLVVSFVAFFILVWGFDYMSHDFNFNFFFLFTCVFVFSMLGFILAKSSFFILACYDLLGFTSFFLVWHYGSFSSISSALITLAMNKIGDLFLMMTLGNLWVNPESLNPFYLLVGIAVKSALVPFSAWLPLAMKAPTPVSALVHSSTLVTAGILLTSKFFFQKLTLLALGSLTMFLASLSALSEMDLKKVVALSTMSQMGLLSILVAGGISKVFFLHLSAHAFLKSLLFVCVGAIMKESTSDQSAKKMSGVLGSQPALLSSCAGLSGLLWSSGQASKESILMGFFFKPWGMIFFFWSILSLTFFYCLKIASPLTEKMKSQTNFPIFIFFLWGFGVLSGSLLTLETFSFTDLSNKNLGMSFLFFGSLFCLVGKFPPSFWSILQNLSGSYLFFSSSVKIFPSEIFLSFQNLIKVSKQNSLTYFWSSVFLFVFLLFV